MNPQNVIIHHSLTKDGTVVDWEAIRRYHKETNGWSDIGYHYGIERVGNSLVLQIGRPESQPGAHTKEMHMNLKSIGICVVGNFDEAPPSLAKLYFLRDLCFSLMVNYGIPAQSVIGHRDAGLMAGFDWRLGQYKTCPGRFFPMDSLRDMLAGKIDSEWIGSGEVTL
jgi:N-acetyl-anhydromuramyl-L-alanine amidase AmpD